MNSEKPLSPHIQIYRWEIMMVLSILHRASGLAMAAGTAVLVWMILALASGEAAYDMFHGFISHPFGRLLLLGWTGALFFHMGNGIRHLFWDRGHGYSISVARRSAWAVLLFAALMTAVVWFFACPWA